MKLKIFYSIITLLLIGTSEMYSQEDLFKGSNFSTNNSSVQSNTSKESVASSKYSATDNDDTSRKGQRDSNGRIIRSEADIPYMGGRMHMTNYEDGYSLISTEIPCNICGGSGKCKVCYGQGRYYHRALHVWNPCPSCVGSTKCKYCQVTGTNRTIKLWAPGEAEAYQAAKREENGSSNSSLSSSKSGICPKCGGKGYTPEAYTYAAGSMMAPYHNPGGTTCPICSQTADHYHYRCTECKRH